MPTKKKWRSGKREGRARRVQLTRHLIVSEGTETEPRYFEGMKSALGSANGRKVAVVVKGSGKHTVDLLDFAIDYCSYAPETYDHVWLVFDKDDFPPADFDAMERKCKESSDGFRTFHALWSNPCFELWLLLHLRYTTAPMTSSECQKALEQAMSRELSVDYRKNLAGVYGMVDQARREAMGRMARLAGHHENVGNDRPSEMNPATRVGEIFNEMAPYLDASEEN